MSARPRKIASKIIGGPARHRAGKPSAVEVQSSSEDEDEDEEEEAQPAPKAPAPRPAASTFPKAVAKPPAPVVNEDEFETEESEGGEDDNDEDERSDASGSGSSEEEEDSSEEEESSSEDDTAKRKMLRPVFVKKGQRNGHVTAPEKTEDEKWAEEEAIRKQRTEDLIQEQLDKRAAARAAGKKDWDESDIDEEDAVDDTDDLDPEAEEAAWKLREIKRVKRDREALIAAEKEREEVERRRNLTAEEREAEDKEFLDKQREEKDGKGKMSYLQKYYHKGAFFQDESKEAGLAQRDIMGSRFQDQVDRSVLPEFLQVRDMTRVGKKGRTRYKDLKSEDTGRWGQFDDRQRRDGDFYNGRDERFMSDRDRERGAERTGANASELGERKRFGEGSGGDSKRIKPS